MALCHCAATGGPYDRNVRSRRKTFWLVGTLVAVAWVAMSVVKLLDARKHAQAGLTRLEQARDQLKSKDLLEGRGESVLGEANAEFERAHDSSSSWLLQPFRLVPFVSQQIGSVDSLAAGAAEITKIGGDALRDVRSEFDRVDRPQGKQRVTMLRRMSKIAKATNVDLAAVSLGPNRYLLPPLRDAHEKFDDNLGDLRGTVSGLVEASAGLVDFMRGPRRYLVIAANNTEMRVGVGAFLSLGELVVRDGKFELGEMLPAKVLEPPAGSVDPGRYDADFEARFGAYKPTDDFRELAQTARFDVLAPLAVDMWKAQGGNSVDGGLVLDPVALQGLLRATGPVEVEGKQYSADNLLDEIFVGQYRGLEINPARTEQVERRDKLSKVARAAIQQLEDGNWKTSELVEALRSAGVGRHILAWSSRSVEQKGWLGASVGGHVAQDGMLVAVQNRGGNKLDQFLTMDNTITTNELGDESTEVVADVKIMNAIPTPIEQFPPYVLGPYLFNENGEAGKYEGSFGVELPRDARNSTIEVDGKQVPFTLGGRNGPDHRVLGTNLVLKPGESITMSVHFTLPRHHRSLLVAPTARVLHPMLGRPATLWTNGIDRWSDEKSHRIDW